MKTVNGKVYMTVNEAATQLGISETHLRNKARLGEVASVRYLGRILFDPETIEKLSTPKPRQKISSVLD